MSGKLAGLGAIPALRRYRYKTVVISSFGPSVIAAARTLRPDAIVNIPHGALSRWANVPDQNWLRDPLAGLHILTSGPLEHELFLHHRWGLHSRIRPGGQPTHSLAYAARSCPPTGLPEVVCFLAQSQPAGIAETIVSWLSLAALPDTIQVCIHPHPAMRPSMLDQLHCRTRSAGFRWSDNEWFLDEGHGCHALLAHWSTALIEASLAGLPTVAVVPEGSQNWLNYPLIVRNVNQLATWLQTSHTQLSAPVSDFLKEHCHDPERSIVAISSYLQELCS